MHEHNIIKNNSDAPLHVHAHEHKEQLFTKSFNYQDKEALDAHVNIRIASLNTQSRKLEDCVKYIGK